jgi:DNA replication licensing factor MCM6
MSDALHRTEGTFGDMSEDVNAGTSMDGTDGLPTPTATQPVAVPLQPARRRMVITHDKYMTLQSLIVLHLSSVERETGKGLDRDELVDWYLEQKEAEIQDLEELEYEKELITKMLRKLVKVSIIWH